MANTRKPKSKPIPALAIKPPAKIGSSGHGPTGGKPRSELHGSARLRSVLSLSANVDLEQVCDEAATIIDQLRSAKPVTGPARFRNVE